MRLPRLVFPRAIVILAVFSAIAVMIHGSTALILAHFSILRRLIVYVQLSFMLGIPLSLVFLILASRIESEYARRMGPNSALTYTRLEKVMRTNFLACWKVLCSSRHHASPLIF